MLDPFGIVKPVLGQYYLAIAKSLAEPTALFLYIVTFRRVTILAVINAHWERVNFYRSFSIDEHLGETVFVASDSEYTCDEVLRVVYCVDSYQVGAQPARTY